MAWLFSPCPDPFGLCIRQYSMLALTLLTFLLASYSLAMTLRSQSRYSFEVIPLLINALATLGLLCALSQFEQENIHLIMGLIQVYSYSLLGYSYAGLYLLANQHINKGQFKRIKLLFLGFSGLVIVGIAVLIILQAMGRIKCQESHGIGHLTVSVLEVPIYIITLTFCIKTKSQIQAGQLSNNPQSDGQLKLLQPQDEYIKIRLKQANTVIFFFTLSILLHLATVIMFWVQSTGCSDTGLLQTRNVYELAMFALFDVEVLVPHFAIPAILYFIPKRNSASGDTIIIQVGNKDKGNAKEREKSELTNNILTSQFESQGIKDMIRRKTSRQST